MQSKSPGFLNQQQSRKRKRPGTFNATRECKCLILENVSWFANKDRIHKLFSKYGIVTELYHQKFQHRCTVTFERTEDATSAKEALSKYILDGDPIEIHYYYKRFQNRGNRGSVAHLWSNVDVSALKMIQMDEVAKYSVTDALTADQQTIVMKAFSFPDSVITDGTACVGGNVVSFAKSFKKVNAVEMNEERYKMLMNNCDLLNVKDKVEFFKGDYTRLHQKIKQDIVFLDPPWGGKEYKLKRVMPLFLGTIPIAKFCTMIRQADPAIKIIGLKVPKNYDRDSVLDESKNTDANMCSYYFRNQILVMLDFTRTPKQFRNCYQSAIDTLPDCVKTEIDRETNRSKPGALEISGSAARARPVDDLKLTTRGLKSLHGTHAQKKTIADLLHLTECNMETNPLELKSRRSVITFELLEELISKNVWVTEATQAPRFLLYHRDGYTFLMDQDRKLYSPESEDAVKLYKAAFKSPKNPESRQCESLLDGFLTIRGECVEFLVQDVFSLNGVRKTSQRERFGQLCALVKQFRDACGSIKPAKIPFTIRGKHAVPGNKVLDLLAMVKKEDSGLVFCDQKGRRNLTEGLIFTQNSSPYVLKNWNNTSRNLFLTDEHAFWARFDDREKGAEGQVTFKITDSKEGTAVFAKGLAKYGVKDLDQDLDVGEAKPMVAEFERFIDDYSTKKTIVVKNARILESHPPLSSMCLYGILEILAKKSRYLMLSEVL